MSKTLYILDYSTITQKSVNPEKFASLCSKLNQETNVIRVLSDKTNFEEGQLEQEAIQSINIKPDMVLDGTELTKSQLASLNLKTVYVIGCDTFISRLKSAGIKVYTDSDHGDSKVEEISLKTDIEAVIISIDPLYDFRKISIATRYVIERKVPLFSVGGERQFQNQNGNYSAGSYTLAVPASVASSQPIQIIGKPKSPCFSDLSTFSSIFVIGSNETDQEYSQLIKSTYISF